MRTGFNQARENFLKEIATLKVSEILDIEALKRWRVPCKENDEIGMLKHEPKRKKPHQGRRPRKNHLVTYR